MLQTEGFVQRSSYVANGCATDACMRICGRETRSACCNGTHLRTSDKEGRKKPICTFELHTRFFLTAVATFLKRNKVVFPSHAKNGSDLDKVQSYTENETFCSA